MGKDSSIEDSSIHMTHWPLRAVADLYSKNFGRATPSPPWSNYLHFPSLFGKFWQNNRLASNPFRAGALAPPGKSWIRRWRGLTVTYHTRWSNVITD